PRGDRGGGVPQTLAEAAISDRLTGALRRRGDRSGLAMAFVHGFENDVFISYAHADNEVDALGDAWVHQLQQNLRIALKQRLGRGDELNVYFDARRLQGNHPLDEILDS